MNFFTVTNGKNKKSKIFFDNNGFIFANKKNELLKIKIEIKKYF